MKRTYKESFDLLTEAYIKDEIKPYDGSYCLCGTLNNNDAEWLYGTVSNCNYSYGQLKQMEYILLSTIRNETVGEDRTEVNANVDFTGNAIDIRKEIYKHPNYEIALFNGFCKALDILKQIHISKGEIIEETPIFTKRKLETA